MFGLNIDPNNPKGNPDAAELKALGVEMVRYTFYDYSDGDQVDPARVNYYTDRIKSYHAVGIRSLIILTYDTYPNRPPHDGNDAPWDQYIDKFVRRSTQIARALGQWNPAFQVWNEPDHKPAGNYVPTLREAVFGRMLRRTYDAIKAVNPNFQVVTAGLAAGNPSWLTRVIRSQGGVLSADIVAFHPYGQRPERNWPNPNWAFGYVGDLLNAYYQAGQRKKMWITEMGIKEQDVGNNRNQASEFLQRYYKTITTHFSDKVEFMHWFCYADGMVPTFGFLEENGNRKPIYDGFKQAVAAAPARITAPSQPTTPTLPVESAPPTPPDSTPPPTPPAIELPAPSTSITPVPASTPDLTKINNAVAALQGQVAQIQQQIQLLSSQQTQMQQMIDLLQQQLRSQGGSTPGLPAPQPKVARPPMQSLINSLPKHATKRYENRSLTQIQRIIVHHTAIVPSVGAERIAEHRVNKQDWPGIGYHYFITGNAVIQQTNNLTTVSRHAGRFDPISIGVCFAGNFTEVAPSDAQIESGAALIAWLLNSLKLPITALNGYKELVNTQSPGIQWDSGARWGEELREQIQARLSG